MISGFEIVFVVLGLVQLSKKLGRQSKALFVGAPVLGALLTASSRPSPWRCCPRSSLPGWESPSAAWPRHWPSLGRTTSQKRKCFLPLAKRSSRRMTVHRKRAWGDPRPLLLRCETGGLATS